jgi:hephaestin
VFVLRTNATIGSKNTKARYVQYSDASFGTPVAQPPAHGLLGPLLSVEVGQNLEVVFFNNLDFEVNLMLDGGLELLSGAGGGDLTAPVAPGDAVTYRYYVPESAGPAGGDLSSVAYAYTSSVDLVGHPNAGLVGVLHVGAKGALKG